MKKDKRRLYTKRIIVNIIVFVVLALSLWAIYTAAVTYSDNVGSLKGLSCVSVCMYDVCMYEVCMYDVYHTLAVDEWSFL